MLVLMLYSVIILYMLMLMLYTVTNFVSRTNLNSLYSIKDEREASSDRFDSFFFFFSDFKNFGNFNGNMEILMKLAVIYHYKLIYFFIYIYVCV